MIPRIDDIAKANGSYGATENVLDEPAAPLQ